MSSSTTLDNIRFSLLILVGLGIAGVGGYSHMAASSGLSSSIMVNGTIESSGVEHDPGRRVGDYAPEVSYNFSYNGSDYTNDWIYPDGSTPTFVTESDAEAEIEEFKEGEKVVVYFTPGDPERSFLKNERTNQPYIFMAAGGLLALLGAYALVN